MADAFECARCGSDRADPRRFSRHGSAIDEAYCDGCWPIVAGELSGSSSKIDPEKMKWIHEVMEGEDGPHPGEKRHGSFPAGVLGVEDPETGIGGRHASHNEDAVAHLDRLLSENPDLDPRPIIDSFATVFKPSNLGIPLRSHKDTTPFFGGRRSQQAQDVLGDKNIDFRASEDPFDYAWDMIVKTPKY